MTSPPLVLVSNRGPVTFRVGADDQLVATRGAGGLTSGLGPLVRGTDTIWIAAAMSPGDQRMANLGLTDAEGFRIRLLNFEPEQFDAYYDGVCNSALWFVHHGLFDPVYHPAWPDGWVEETWAAYRAVNAAFADAVVQTAPPNAVVLIQDYHLCLLAESVRARRPDLRLVHFSHTPFAAPAWLRSLPRTVRSELLMGLAGHHVCGFHTERWRNDFLACLQDAELGIEPSSVGTFVAPLGPDAHELDSVLDSDACAAALAQLDAELGDREFLVRVDRLELSKNVLRGFDAFEALLVRRPELRGRVIFGAYLYPSRAGISDYDRYGQAVEDKVNSINERFSTTDWTPIWLDAEDDFPRSIAALARADAVLVNPIRDGLNLVAKEAVLVNQRSGQLILSPEAGAWEELGEHSWRADPFDIEATADAIDAALSATPDERHRRHGALRAAVAKHSPATWLAAQVAAALP